MPSNLCCWVSGICSKHYQLYIHRIIIHQNIINIYSSDDYSCIINKYSFRIYFYSMQTLIDGGCSAYLQLFNIVYIGAKYSHVACVKRLCISISEFCGVQEIARACQATRRRTSSHHVQLLSQCFSRIIFHIACGTKQNYFATPRESVPHWRSTSLLAKELAVNLFISAQRVDL